MAYTVTNNPWSSQYNVGVGTDAPQAYGHGGTNVITEIQSPTTSANSQAHIILTTGATTNAGSIGTITWAGSNFSTAKRAGIIGCLLESGVSTTPQSALQFYTSDTTNGIAEKMRLNSTGHLGIGCVPSSLLHLAGGGAGTRGALRISEIGLTNYWELGRDNTVSGDFTINSNATERMRVTTAGAIGIGTTTPGTYRLNVNGTFYSAGSSLEYKTDITTLDTDTNKILELRPVTYQYKDEYKHLGKELKSGTQIGLIAEEVAEVFPELALLKQDEDGETRVRNVDYEKLSILLLSEVQKLRKEVNELKNK
jgi:hypothetical protein